MRFAVFMLLGLEACFTVHGPAVLITPPTPPAINAMGPSGAVAYPLYGTASDSAAVRHDAYAMVHKACDGQYRIWSENSDLNPTERAEANRTGVTFPQNDAVWIIRFSCERKQ